MRTDAATAIRRRLIAAIERRTAGADGQARRMLEARLAGLRACAGETPEAAPDAAPEAAAPPPGPLRELVGRLDAAPSHEAYPELPALADFRQLWSNLRAESQLRQAVDHAPADAGPLNSTALASRAIALMRELSPAYLRAFLAYVDDLAWLERLDDAGATAPAGPAGTRKRARRTRQS